MSRRRSIRPRNQREGPEQLPLVVPPKTRAGVEPEQAAKVAVARRAKPSALPDHVKLVLTLDLRRALAERLSAKAISEGKNLDGVVIEILEAGAKQHMAADDRPHGDATR
jgi:hypothetical protein